ncbi:uncharacterized protein LY89DRAFT_653844 [Mollisia scopiformis]|uniref:Uncharacterized protein n=1 Tax=Mollisia scopiformis TaxID=149040 RepID=A0A194WWQ8_MOLSC|nr:uncharacterized protein LY89DRAFT_653844 [Mollisia scopiformis]KUJ12119.1 hypothetical protein LY89DRAFT_653844 [Mollisia scopiformis]
MLASRTTRAAARSLRAPVRANARQIRFASTDSTYSSSSSSSAINSQAVIGGIVGGSLVFLAGYGYYHTSGAKTFVNAAQKTKSELNNITQKLSSSAPEPNQALKWLRSTATSYASFIPGAKSYVDSAFNDLEKIQAKHGKEVDDIVNKAYNDLKDVSKKGGVDMQTASKSWTIIEEAISELGKLSVDSASEILDNHPKLKEQVGGNLDQLKSMADSYGPEAKKELEATYQQIKDVLKAGVGFDTVDKIKKLVEEKTEKVKGMGDEAWKRGIESAKPYLDKNPEIKKIVEDNKDALRKGNVAEVLKKISEALYNKDPESLKQYIKQAGEKAKQSAGGFDISGSLEQYAKMIPGGEEILPKLKKLQEVAKSRGDDAEKILKGAYQDVQDVLQKRTKEVERLAEEAKKDAKK